MICRLKPSTLKLIERDEDYRMDIVLNQDYMSVSTRVQIPLLIILNSIITYLEGLEDTGYLENPVDI